MTMVARRAALFAGAVAATVLVPAAPAAATPSCSFDSGVMSISLPNDGDVIPVFTEENGDILFDDPFFGGDCGGVQATVHNTDRIEVTGGPGRQDITFYLDGGPLAPGATDEAGGSDEIEVSVDLGGAPDDGVIVYGSFGADDYRASDAGVNLNADEVDGVDVDVTLAGVTVLDVFASRGADVVDATGYSKTVNIYGQEGADVLTGGLGLAFGMSKLDGGTENDRLVGGPGIDRMNGFYGTDTLIGNGGDDLFETGANADGSDTLKGGKGVDGVSYLPRTNGVAISLDGAANDGEAGEGDNVGSDVENLTGSKGNDTLTGNRKPNFLRGLDGDDTLSGADGRDRLEGDAGNDDLTGGGSVDELYGAAGNDDLFAFDDYADLADGGTGTDSCDCDSTDIRRNLP